MAGMPWDEDAAAARRRDPVAARGMKRIGAATRERRQRRHLSQRDLGVLTGLHQSTICRFERGERCGMRWVRFAAMVEILGGLDFDPHLGQTFEQRLFGPAGLNPYPPVALEQLDELEAALAKLRAGVEDRERARLVRERKRFIDHTHGDRTHGDGTHGDGTHGDGTHGDHVQGDQD